MFLGTGTMVVCLKHVGITDSERDSARKGRDAELFVYFSIVRSKCF